MGDRISDNAAAANGPFGRLVVQCLARLGVEHFVVSPGSRSTPLAVAACSLSDARATMVLDERSAAFQALGRIKAIGRPVALICTSGSAAAHYFPAVIEAREAGLPLIVLTADRPPELRQCHAGQTIDQVKIYGSYPVFQAELPLPEPDALLFRQTREICRRALEASVAAPAGPVHLNCPFREPFFNGKGTGFAWEEQILEGLVPVVPTFPAITETVTLPERTIILAGPRVGKDAQVEMVALQKLASRFDYPILADGSNPLRYEADSEAVTVIHYDRIARVDSLWEQLKPEAVILWGEPPTSKVLRQRLAEMDLPGFQIGSGKRGMNPIHGRIRGLGCSVADFGEAIAGKAGNYAEAWLSADLEMEQSLVNALARPHPLFEGDVHRTLGKILPDAAQVYFASSLAIRDADWFMPKREKALTPFCQRGANGIDGTLSLCRGIAAGSGKPVYLVSGDLAFLHDSGGLLGSANDRAGVMVLLINNSGGGIFEFLPAAHQEIDFEQVFATPQTVDFAGLVHAHGGSHVHVNALPDLEQHIRGWDGKGLHVLEIPVDRKASFDLHKQFLKL